jgi:putative ATP-dependent endonuclease of the OLD family
MHISELRIRNFRNFLGARFSFSKGVNTLIGENGSGKTNALYALRLLLDDALARRAMVLKASDFCRAIGKWKGHWIVISLDFQDLDPCEGCQLLKHQAGHMDGTARGTYTLVFRPKLQVRKRLFELTEAGSKEDTASYLDSLTIDDYESVVTGRAQGDILDDSVYAALVGDLEELAFPNPDEEDQSLLGVRTQPIYGEITCTFAPALRDVVSDLRGYRSSPLLALLRGTETTIQIEDAQRIVAAVGQLNNDIASLQEIKDIAAGIQSTLCSTVGHTYSPVIGIESALPDEMDKLLQHLDVKVGDSPGSSYQGDLADQSLGGANLIYLALKLLEYELKLSTDRVAHFLLMEEPEAHIHTHIQKTLFENQPTARTQVIVSTHSTHISSAARIRSVNVLAQKVDHAEVYQPAEGLDESAVQRVERYLDAVRSTLLFARGVLLIEGAAELILLPSLLRAVFGLLPDEMGLSVISMDSAFFEHVATVFDTTRVRRRCAIITDHDQPYFDLAPSADDDNDDQKHARAAALAGQQRCDKLEDFCQGNAWIRPFFADHTFEVDLLAAGNCDEFCAVVSDLYSRKADRERVAAILQNENLAVSGKEAVRLAKATGKGWFSLLLAEKLDVRTQIPAYIMQAVAFAVGESLNDEVLKRMGLYRISNGALSEDLRATLPTIQELEKLPAPEFMQLFAKAAPGDALTTFSGYAKDPAGS